MQRSFGSYKEIKKIPMSGSAGMRARSIKSINPLKVLDYQVF